MDVPRETRLHSSGGNVEAFKSVERNYDAYDLEAQAATQVIKKWRVCIEGSKRTTLVTDHNTLTRLLTQKTSRLEQAAGWVG